MSHPQPNNPLHGLTLEQVVTGLVERYGWDGLARKIRINCFAKDPSVKSSLKFLRKTGWARNKVESLYIETFAPKPDPWGRRHTCTPMPPAKPEKQETPDGK